MAEVGRTDAGNLGSSAAEEELLAREKLESAADALRAGGRVVAARICRQLLRRGRNVAASCMLTQIAMHHGRRDWAELWLLASFPDATDAIQRAELLVGACLNLGQLDAAAALCEEALRTSPGAVRLELSRGKVLASQQRLQDAISCFEGLLAIDPEFLEARVCLGEVLLAAGEAAASVVALEVAPRSPAVRICRAIALEALGRTRDASDDYRQALRLDPASLLAHGRLSSICLSCGDLDEAISLLRRIIDLDPANAVAFNNLGLAIERKGELRGAEICFKRASRLDPKLPHAHNNLARMLQRRSVTCAIRHYSIAVRLDPHLAEAFNNRGNALMSQTRLSEALQEFRRAFELNQDYHDSYSNYLFAMNYSPDCDDVFLARTHCHCPFLRPPRNQQARSFVGHSSEKGQPMLRLGLLSGDFAHHPLGYFTMPLVLGMNYMDDVAVFLYSNRRLEDDLTLELKKACAGWRAVANLSDQMVADRIRDDELDVLIDLSGHTQGNRLGCLEFEPAPILMHWSYVHSIPSVHYSIWDRYQILDDVEAHFTELILRLSDARFCYAPPRYAPEVAAAPVSRQRSVVFGSFNNPCKLNDGVIDLWARILRELPELKLILSWKTFADRSERDRMRAAFASRGVEGRRIYPRCGAPSHAGVLGEYAEVDVALDPFPFSGCLTTLEALWMGVPVVTLPQSRPSSRQSFAFLNVLGRTEWIARDADDYVRIACTLSEERGMLQSFRATQRKAMSASPLCDGRRFAANFVSTIWSCL